MTPILQATDLTKRFGGLLACNGLSLSVQRGDIHALIGPNGAGKSTAIGLLSGEIAADSGRIAFAGATIGRLRMPARVRRGLARSFQITCILPQFTALANVALVAQVQAGHSFRFWAAARRDRALTGPAQAMLERVGLGARAAVLAEDLAHGEQRQLELAMALMTGAEMLLLDEPMAGLGAAESQAMTAQLAALKGDVTLLLVEHDMDAVAALADRVSVMVAGRVIAEGSFAAMQASPVVRAAYLGEAYLGEAA